MNWNQVALSIRISTGLLKIPIAFQVIPSYIDSTRIFPFISYKELFYEQVRSEENLTDKNASEIVNMIPDGFTDTLKKGGRIEIRGFGSFTVREYGAYTGRNPKNGKKVEVKPKKLPFFKVGKELKERVNQGSK